MTLTIDGKPLDDPTQVFIIAEASGNHSQEYGKAEALVQAAAHAGASAVKFQTFTAEELCVDVPILFGHDAAHDAWCQQLGVTRLRDLFKKGGLPREWHAPLKALAESLGLIFLSTPFSIDAARFLVEAIGVPALKIASGDLTFLPLHAYAAGTGLPTLMSTGGATVEEIRTTLRLYYSQSPASVPVLMHCVSVYPCEASWANLAALRTMAQQFPGSALGWSDHTLSWDLVPALALACGATVIEKHLRLGDDTTSVDAGHALTPVEFRQMVRVLRDVSAILGHGRKEPHALELHDRVWARRGIDGLRPTEEARGGRWQ